MLPADPVQAPRVLVQTGQGWLPLPGSGGTLQRGQALARVASQDLSLSRPFEGHTDGVAILAALGAPSAPGTWATWCAEPPDARVQFSEADPAGWLLLSGRQAWCSGAAGVDHSLVSGWNIAGEPCLAAVHPDQQGVRITADAWRSTGMAATRSVDVHFDGAASLTADGALVACDWLPDFPGRLCGTDALRAERANPGLQQAMAHIEDDFGLKLWTTDPHSVAQREGIRS